MCGAQGPSTRGRVGPPWTGNYATQYRRIYETHWWWRAREAAIMREVSRLLSPCLANRILDVGCGDGLLFQRLEPYGHVEGVEIDPFTITSTGPGFVVIHVGPFDKSFRTPGVTI